VTGVQTCALPISPKPQNPLFKSEKLIDNLMSTDKSKAAR
jgi:hypothetical protein